MLYVSPIVPAHAADVPEIVPGAEGEKVDTVTGKEDGVPFPHAFTGVTVKLPLTLDVVNVTDNVLSVDPDVIVTPEGMLHV